MIITEILLLRKFAINLPTSLFFSSIFSERGQGSEHYNCRTESETNSSGRAWDSSRVIHLIGRVIGVVILLSFIGLCALTFDFFQLFTLLAPLLFLSPAHVIIVSPTVRIVVDQARLIFFIVINYKIVVVITTAAEAIVVEVKITVARGFEICNSDIVRFKRK